jgi:hypothetical protein
MRRRLGLALVGAFAFATSACSGGAGSFGLPLGALSQGGQVATSAPTSLPTACLPIVVTGGTSSPCPGQTLPATPLPTAAPLSDPTLSPLPTPTSTAAGGCPTQVTPLPQLVAPAAGSIAAPASGQLTLTLGFFQQPPTSYWKLGLQPLSTGIEIGPLEGPVSPPSGIVPAAGEQFYTTTLSGLSAQTIYGLEAWTAYFGAPPSGGACSLAIRVNTLGEFTTP